VVAVLILFWLSVFGLAYIFVGYPLLIKTLAHFHPGPEPVVGAVRPFSVVIVGYNEAKNLTAKIESIFASTVAEHLVDLHVASDGSDDDTASLLDALADKRIVHHAFAERRGKAAVLNEVVPSCKTEIVILTDARQVLNAEALQRLLERFGDERVGVVSGELVLDDGEGVTSAGKGMGAYWRYEKMIRQAEARYKSVPGATGALYAMRKDLYQPIPEDSLLDDVAIPMRVVLQGYRCVFEGGALAFDAPSETALQESVRKRRTISGNVQVVQQCPAILSPSKNPIWMQFVSHKLARLGSPFLLLSVLICAWLLREDVLYFWALLLQLVFYVLAIVGWLLQAVGVKTGVLGVPLMFTSLNLTTGLAWIDILSGRYVVTWDRSDKA